jgi:hypothetical protein
MNADMKALEKIDAIPVNQKSSISSARMNYPTDMIDDTATPSLVNNANSAFMRGSNTDERSNRHGRNSSYA